MPAPRRPRGVEFGTIADDLIAEPLAFLAAEHARQGALLGHLARIARQPGAPRAAALAGALAPWLADDLPRHLAEEERCLHASLRPFDSAGILRRLAPLGAEARQDLPALVADLNAIATHRPVPKGFADRALRFAAALRAYLDLEEAEVIPLARRWLAAEALAHIAADMAAQRS